MVAGNKFQSNPYILRFWYLYIFYLKMLYGCNYVSDLLIRGQEFRRFYINLTMTNSLLLYVLSSVGKMITFSNC